MKRFQILLLLFFTHSSFAQSVLRLQHISVEDGLSQSSVNYILQDAHGFMWFATGDGLDRYDGKEFVIYKSRFNDTLAAQMKDRNINSSIFEDEQNRLWMSTDGGLSYMNSRNGHYHVVLDKYKIENDPVIVGVDNTSLWAVVPQKGIYEIDLATTGAKMYLFADSLQTKSERVYPISCGAVTSDGVWVVDKAGLLYFDKKKHTDERKIINNAINCAIVLKNGKLFLTGTGAVYLFDSQTKKIDSISILTEGMNRPMIWESCVEDVAANTVYMGTVSDGIICKFHLDTRKYEFIDFQSSPVNCLYLDHSRNLWIGTEGNGVFKLDVKQPKFNCYTPGSQKTVGMENSFMVKSIFRDDSGKIWIGTYNNGLVIYDPTSQKQRTVPFPFATNGLLVTTILKDSSGYIVITIGSIILWLDPLTCEIKRQTKLPLELELSPEEPVIYSLVEWKKNHYLAGTNLSLFSLKYENGDIAAGRPHIFRTEKFISSHTYDLHLEKDGTINVGKRNGYVKVKMVDDTAVNLIEEGFDRTVIRHFYKSTTTPILWIASEKGLIAYNEVTKQHTIFDESDGLSNSFVYAILPQNDSSLWISTNKGLSNVKVHYGKKITADFVNYSAKDGLQSNEFNTGAYYQAKDGTLFFGGIAGINWFSPGNISPNLNKAIPAIADIYVNDSLFARDSANYIRLLALPSRKNTISFSLRALEYTKPGQNRFAYKLQGLEEDWVITSNDKVRYSNLPPGNYTFLLKVSNNEGVWNEDPLVIKIIINPPYWQTWWFRTMVLLAAVMLVILIIRIYVRQKIRVKTRELEKQQALYMERLRISKDVHDDLGSGLSKISLMAEMARKKQPGDQSIGSDIGLISTVSKELVENIRDLIWVLNPDNTTLEQLVARLREYCADYLENLPVTYHLDFPHNVPAMRISKEAQRNIFLTTKEAINNCIKHAGATEIKVSLLLEDAMLSIAVADNGKGFDRAHLKGSGNGLRNMQQRIELVGGRFAITSVSGGTTVSILVPFENLGR